LSRWGEGSVNDLKRAVGEGQGIRGGERVQGSGFGKNSEFGIQKFEDGGWPMGVWV
jgi:hypothetical protein